MKLLVLIILLFAIYFYYKFNYENFTVGNARKNKLCIIVTTYNPGPKFIERCLKSIINQSYINYSVCIVDDASTKDVKEVHDIINEYCNKYNWKFVKRTTNIGPLGGRIDAINALNPNEDDIIVSIDGDDELNNEYVFKKINQVYQDDKILLTFGNYVNRDIHTGKLSKPKINCRRHNFKKMIKNNSFRDNKWLYTHLKTFKYKLYKKINHEDLKRDGEYLKSATDFALMFPMIEMSGGNFKCISNVLYKYNREHVESHNTIGGKKHNEQTRNANYVRSLKKYDPIF
jgi:glycosyltransferase involved in cell wall biosynthesis